MRPDRDRRTEPATERRRREARERGQVASSRHLVAAASLTSGVLLWRFGGGADLGSIARSFRSGLAEAFRSPLFTPEEVARLAGRQTLATLSRLAPLVATVAAVTLVVGWAQTGFLLRPGLVGPSSIRISPRAGFDRIVSWRSVIRGLLAALELAVLGIVVWRGALAFAPGHPHSVLARVGGLAGLDRSLDALASRLLVACEVLLALSFLDWLLQRWLLERDLKMTPEELRDELREQEADPLVLEGRRRLARRLRRPPSAPPPEDRREGEGRA